MVQNDHHDEMIDVSDDDDDDDEILSNGDGDHSPILKKVRVSCCIEKSLCFYFIIYSYLPLVCIYYETINSVMSWIYRPMMGASVRRVKRHL